MDNFKTLKVIFKKFFAQGKEPCGHTQKVWDALEYQRAPLFRMGHTFTQLQYNPSPQIKWKASKQKNLPLIVTEIEC